jgi:hypothetical protein
MSAFPPAPADKPGFSLRRAGYFLPMERDKPYEGEEATTPGEDFSGIDPDEMTGPGGRLPAADGLTDADDPKDGST